MPLKKRIKKARAFDEYHKEQLLAGPDACLLAGVGYLSKATWGQMSPAEQEAARVAMEADWNAHGAGLMRWWTQDFPPWAAEQFGEPPCR